MHAWILVMIIFGVTSNPSGISHMEVLKVYKVQKECSDAITKALSIKMPIAREFRCLKYQPLKHRKANYGSDDN